MRPLVVEGITDAVFFCELIKRFHSDTVTRSSDQPGRRGIPQGVRGVRADGTVIDLEFKNQMPQPEGGKEKIPEAVRGLVRDGGVKNLIVSRDLDDLAPGTVVDSIKSVLRNLLGGSIEDASDHKFRAQNVTLPENQLPKGDWVDVVVIPMGLPDDTDLVSLGINNHEMEDYLVHLSHRTNPFGSLRQSSSDYCRNCLKRSVRSRTGYLLIRAKSCFNW